MIKFFLLLIFLIICTITDLNNREINLLLSIIFSSIGFIILLFQQEQLFLIFLSTVPGILLIICGRIFSSDIGIGDGLMITTCGLFCSFFTVLSLFFTSIFLLLITGIIFIVKKSASFKSRLPFAPFLLASLIFHFSYFL